MSKEWNTDIKKIGELYNGIEEGIIEIKPYFQRNLVWNDKHKENFIQTILLGLPFPEIYMSQGDVDTKTGIIKKDVVDGQQRLNAIREYKNGTLNIKTIDIKPYNKLTKDEQKKFLTYKVIVRDLGNISDDEIKQIFRRINSVRYALNAMEVNKALYEGEYISTARDILDKQLLQQFEIFSESQQSRMQDWEFVLTIMTTIESGMYFNANKENEIYIKKYDNKYENKKHMIDDFVETLNTIISLKLDSDSIWFIKSSFFSLLSELLKYKKMKKKLPTVSKLKKILINLENRIISSKHLNEKHMLARFYKFIYQATARKDAREARGLVLEEALNKI